MRIGEAGKAVQLVSGNFKVVCPVAKGLHDVFVGFNPPAYHWRTRNCNRWLNDRGRDCGC
jgi:hypothetical protein